MYKSVERFANSMDRNEAILRVEAKPPLRTFNKNEYLLILIKQTKSVYNLQICRALH
jgi:hypothetical protein